MRPRILRSPAHTSTIFGLAILLALLSVACSVPRTPVDPVGPSPGSPSTPAPVATSPAPDPVAHPAPLVASGPAVPTVLVGAEWTALPTTENVVALTFDAGADADGVPPILETLETNGVPATFFLTGGWTEQYPDRARTIAGWYPVGNHTNTHPYLTHETDEGVRSEVLLAGDLISSIAGRETRPHFRFPFGDSDARTIQIVNGLGYGAIGWTVDTVGWRGTSGGESVDSVIARVLDNLRPGAIVLMHVGSHPEDGSTLDADALPSLIVELRARGYGFVTIDQFL